MTVSPLPRILILATLILAPVSGWPVRAQPAAPPDTTVSAAGDFERTLEEAGLEAACARLREILADTSGTYAIDGAELVRRLPGKLVLAGRPEAALGLVREMGAIFGESPEYWAELADVLLQNQRADEAAQALRRSLAIEPDQPQAVWTLENLDRLAAVIRIQVEAQGCWRPGQNTGLQGEYLGQDPPGTIPEVFAPGLLSTLGHEYSLSFGPDGGEIVFSRGGVGTLVCRRRPDGWTAPEPLPLRGAEYLCEEASLAPDGVRIFFCSQPIGRPGERMIYVAERRGAGWSEARFLFPGMYPTATREGVLYYTEAGGRPDYGVLVRRRPTPGGYGDPEVLDGPGINSPAPDAHPYIAPDGGLLLFDSYRQPGAGLYVSFRSPDGGWTEARPLGERLGIPQVGQPALSHDGKYLFFCLAGDMYWVDAAVLDSIRPRGRPTEGERR